MRTLSKISSAATQRLLLFSLRALGVATAGPAETCEPSRFNPESYSRAESNKDLRHLIAADLARYKGPDDAVPMFCFVRHFNDMNAGIRLWTGASIDLGIPSKRPEFGPPGPTLFRFGPAALPAPPGEEETPRNSVLLATSGRAGFRRARRNGPRDGA